MGIAMLVLSLPAVVIVDRSLRIPPGHRGVGSLVAVLMAVGSIFYALALQRLPAAPATAIATTYVVVVVVLSVIFLHESLDPVKVVGLGLTLAGVSLLAFRT